VIFSFPCSVAQYYLKNYPPRKPQCPARYPSRLKAILTNATPSLHGRPGARAASAALLVAALWAALAGAGVADVPSSARSREAALRVKAALASDLARKGQTMGSAVFMRIFKETAELELWVKTKGDTFALFRTYDICYFSGALGPKVQVGDGQSPEGFYRVGPSQLNPSSQFHLSFNLGYPNQYDRAWGRTGSALMVHGNCVSIGCYAMTNAKIEEIYTLADAALRAGQPAFSVHVFPFRMAPERLAAEKGSRWYEFWGNLKQGYDLFEKTRVPPVVSLRNKRYVFE
jgi:murein L,D-transpeptidase YafK